MTFLTKCHPYNSKKSVMLKTAPALGFHIFYDIFHFICVIRKPASVQRKVIILTFLRLFYSELLGNSITKLLVSMNQVSFFYTR